MTLSGFPGLLQGPSQNCRFGVPVPSNMFSFPVLLNGDPDLYAIGVLMQTKVLTSKKVRDT